MDNITGSIVSSPSKLLPRACHERISSENEKDKCQEKSLVESSHLEFDEVDGLRGKANFNWLDVVCIVVSICSYVADLITDGFMAATYFNMGHYWYFGFTLAFVAIPAFTMSGLSTKWYIKDQNNQNFPPVSKCIWAFRIFCLIFFLSPVARYVDTLRYGLQSRRAKKRKDYRKMGQCYARMAYEDADATFLRLFECFMESAPQLVLQLYIIAKTKLDFGTDPLAVTFQAASVVTSVISLAWALTTYNRSLRFAQVDKENIHLLGTCILFFAHLFGIIARVIALSFFASEYGWFVWAVCLGHWILMAIWLWLQRTAACSTRTEEFFFCLILAIIHVFTFFNVKPDRTRFRYAFYYIVCFFENTTLMVLWWLKVADYGPTRPWFHYPALVGQFGSFALSIALLGFYYKSLHPNLLLPNVGICSKNGTTLCLSDVQPPIVNGVPSPRTSPARMGRLDIIQQEAQPEV
ncbi:XK-related protein 4-like [Daphnia carinata]|uniref:XK-related protein 4-like n=1 Tax=Daphnia carinata TaxID=120202 RepID=UPI00257C6BF2|nr:XK-related protein 4-like [Daphnia carinata]